MICQTSPCAECGISVCRRARRGGAGRGLARTISIRAISGARRVAGRRGVLPRAHRLQCPAGLLGLFIRRGILFGVIFVNFNSLFTCHKSQ